MMTIFKQKTATGRSTLFNRALYALFVALSVYFLFFRKDLASAMTNLGLALVFDPFDQSVMWSNRPLYQRVWLLVHVGLVISLLVYLIFSGAGLR